MLRLLMTSAFGALLSMGALAEELVIPHEFTNGAPTNAQTMNENFSAVASKVNSLLNRLETLEAESQADFLGFSQQLVDGSYGQTGMVRACDLEFPGSRVCTSEDVLGSSLNPGMGNLSGNAWLFPSFVPSATLRALDASGVGTSLNDGNISCGGWSTVDMSQLGLVVNSTLGFGQRSCNQSLPVACCR